MEYIVLTNHYTAVSLFSLGSYPFTLLASVGLLQIAPGIPSLFPGIEERSDLSLLVLLLQTYLQIVLDVDLNACHLDIALTVGS